MTWRSTGVSPSKVLPGDLVGVDVDGTPIVLVNFGGPVRALQGECPHLGAALAEGTLSGRRLTCILHEAAFDVETGAVAVDPFGIEPPAGEVPAARTYPTRAEGDELWVDLP
ncbi:MAG: Rieske (2Fe-2S) protein [Thermoplasmata archaeon]|jgi:nitrite reductase/ring-hydroxylating ferredoxin subunit